MAIEFSILTSMVLLAIEILLLQPELWKLLVGTVRKETLITRLCFLTTTADLLRKSSTNLLNCHIFILCVFKNIRFFYVYQNVQNILVC